MLNSNSPKSPDIQLKPRQYSLQLQNNLLRDSMNKKKAPERKLSKCDDMISPLERKRKPPSKRVSSVLSTTTLKKYKKSGTVMINQYKVIKELGSGAFAKVKLCEDINTNNFYAIKIMNKKELKAKSGGKGRSAYDCVLDELTVLKRLEHPNIIWLHEIIDDENKSDIYLVTEYHSKGSIGDLIKLHNKKYDDFNYQCKLDGKLENQKKIGLNPKVCRFYFLDMLKALYYCHKTIQVIHRDIKPDNIMINHYDEAVLIDFGVSALFQDADDTLKNNMGSYIFFAPEMFLGKSSGVKIRGEKTDIWALGVTLFYMLTGKYPSGNVTDLLDLRSKI